MDRKQNDVSRTYFDQHREHLRKAIAHKRAALRLDANGEPLLAAYQRNAARQELQRAQSAYNAGMLNLS